MLVSYSMHSFASHELQQALLRGKLPMDHLALTLLLYTVYMPLLSPPVLAAKF
jgi:hypothetical protein